MDWLEVAGLAKRGKVAGSSLSWGGPRDQLDGSELQLRRIERRGGLDPPEARRVVGEQEAHRALDAVVVQVVPMLADIHLAIGLQELPEDTQEAPPVPVRLC